MVLDDTPGSPAANTYLTVEAADDIAEAQGLGRAARKWIDAGEETKEKALIRATSEVDAYVINAGTRWALDQALLFPRLGDVDDVDEPYIIGNIRLATYEQAVHLLLNADLIDDANSRRARGLIQFADDDGSGSVVAVRPDFGLMSSQAIAYLRPLRGLGRSTLVSVPIASTYR